MKTLKKTPKHPLNKIIEKAKKITIHQAILVILLLLLIFSGITYITGSKNVSQAELKEVKEQVIFLNAEREALMQILVKSGILVQKED